MYICVYILVHTIYVSHTYSLLEGHILHMCHIYIASIATYYICVTYIATYYICVTYIQPIRGAIYVYMCLCTSTYYMCVTYIQPIRGPHTTYMSHIYSEYSHILHMCHIYSHILHMCHIYKAYQRGYVYIYVYISTRTHIQPISTRIRLAPRCIQQYSIRMRTYIGAETGMRIQQYGIRMRTYIGV